MAVRHRSYQVLLTPLVAKDTYGDIVDVSQDIEIDDYVDQKGITSINREIDNGDFDFGVFVYDSVNLKCFNIDGKFSTPNDSRSIFRYSRDKAKIKINFFDGINENAVISFDGLIDERATRMNFDKDEIKFKVLSQDSIINRVKVPAGSIPNNTLVSNAIKNLLQLSDIVAVLNYDEANINTQTDFLIDDGSYFDNLILKDALDEMMAATNSTLIINQSGDMIVRSRDFNSGSVFRFFGHGDIFLRENMVNITKYNNGLHRMFNTVTVGNQSVSNAGLIDAFGDNEKTIGFDWITNPITQLLIAANLLDNWKAPKEEFIVTARTVDVKELDFFDLVSVNYPYQISPDGNNDLPIYGVSRYGEAVYPRVRGNIKIEPTKAFKVIGIKENPNNFLTQIKLRNTGKEIFDGYFSDIAALYGSAVYGQDQYQNDPDRIDPNIRSHYGAARYGTVHYGNI